MALQRGIWFVLVLIPCATVTANLHNWYHHHHGSSGHTGSGSSHTGSGSSSSSDHCHNCGCDEYKILNDLGNTQECVDENKVFPLLKALNSKSHTCRKNVIDHLARIFEGVSDTPSNCQCAGKNTFHNYQYHSDNPFPCYPDQNFDHIYNRFFNHIGSPHSPPACRSQHAMWTELARVGSSEHYGSKSCQQMLVEHIGDMFAKTDPCSCSIATHQQATTTARPIPTATSLPIASTTTPVSHTATTGNQQVSVKWSCGKLSTVEAIAMQHHLDQQNATMCNPGNQHGSDEAFVLINCNTPNPSMWKQGVNVLQHCKEIPTYTPVATFIGGTYHPSLAESGVFMGCIVDGFKLGVQHCNSTPTIDHVLRSSSGLQNAQHYYVIN